MLLLGGQANGWLPADDQHTVGLLLAAFVFPLETIAAVVAFAARDTFGATGLGLFATSWLAGGLANLLAPAGELSRTVALYEFGFACAIGLLAVAAMLGKPLIGTILLLSTVRAALAGVYQWTGDTTVERAAGWLGVAIFATAMYGGLAFLLEDVQQRTVLPVFRRGASKTSIEGDLHDQLRGLAREAGVRQTL